MPVIRKGTPISERATIAMRSESMNMALDPPGTNLVVADPLIGPRLGLRRGPYERRERSGNSHLRNRSFRVCDVGVRHRARGPRRAGASAKILKRSVSTVSLYVLWWP